MAILRGKKKQILENLNKAFKDSESVTFVNFHGMNVSDTTEMRRALRENGVGYYVAKKTLIKKALEDSKFEGDLPELPGEIAVAYGEDETASAREVYNFQKKFGDNLQIVGGIFGGKFMGQAEMNEIASIPGAEVLYGQLVGLLTSPVRSFAVALSEIAKTKE